MPGMRPEAARRLHGPRPATRSRCSSSHRDAARPGAGSRRRAGTGARRGSRARSCAAPAGSTEAARRAWCWPPPATPATCRCSSGRRARLEIDLSGAGRRGERRTGHARRGHGGVPPSAGPVGGLRRCARCSSGVRRTGRSPPRCPTGTSTAAPGTWPRRRSAPTNRRRPRSSRRAARAASAARTRPRPPRSSAPGGSPPTASGARGCCGRRPRRAGSPASTGRAVALLDEARASTGDPRLLVEIDRLAGHIATRRGPVMRGHAILTAAAERRRSRASRRDARRCG